MTPYDAGNYTCVPSYALPDWAQVFILHGKWKWKWKKNIENNLFNGLYDFLFTEDNQAELYDGVSEVKLDTRYTIRKDLRTSMFYLNVRFHFSSARSFGISPSACFLLQCLVLFRLTYWHSNFEISALCTYLF